MFFTQDNQTLYLSTWNYNAVLIIEELKQIIVNNGGRVDETRPGYIVNRSIMEIVNKCKIDADKVRERIEAGEIEANEARNAFIKSREAEAAALEAIPNEPRKVSNNNYLRFILDNTMYYVELNDNPFFDFYYNKTPINGDKYSRDTYGEKLNKDFLWDCFLTLKKPATDADRREAANMIYNALVSAKNCEKYRESHKTRVPNTYNNGYHYETIYTPERLETVKF